MKLARVAIAVAALLLVCSLLIPSQAQSKARFSFGYYGPGVSFHVGRYPHYYYSPHYYGGYHYSPYYYSSRPYHRHYRRSYRRPRAYGGRCGYWSQRCVANWGYRNSNYYGCLKYHGCR